MIQAIGLFLLIWAAVAANLKIKKEEVVFREFGQSTAIRWLIWLYPLPLLLPFVYSPLTGLLLIPLPLDVLFFLPAVVCAKANKKAFQRTGTDRARRAEEAADYVITSGLIAMLGAVFCSLFWLVLTQVQR
jgi:hypothetical protein